MNLSQLNRVLLQTLLLPVAALVLLASVLTWQIFVAESTVADIQVLDKNIATANLIAALISDQEKGLQSYEKFRRRVYLQPYDVAVEPIQSNLAQLRQSIVSQHADLGPIDGLTEDHKLWVDSIAKPTIEAIDSGQANPDPRLDARGRVLMAKIRTVEDAIIANQTAQRTALADDWRLQALHAPGLFIAITVAIGLLITMFARSQLQKVSVAFQEILDAVVSNASATYQSEERLRATFISIAESVVVCDIDGRIEMLNTVAQRVSGWSQADALDRPLSDVFPLTDELTHEPLGGARFTRKNAAAQSAAAAADPSSQPPATVQATRSAVLTRPDGVEFLLEREDAPVYDSHGYLIGSVIVLSDITGQRRTQAALLASEKLAVAGRLAATIAHEIHNPLDSVVNLLFMMKQGVTAEEHDEFLEMAQSELSRVTQISRALLGMHRESRTPVSMDVAAVMQSVLVLLQRSIARAGIALHTSLEEDATATGYPTELRQVFTNLLTNAVDASQPETRIDVSVRTRPEHRAPGDLATQPAGVIVCISDQGSGISPEVLADLFKPFFTTKGERGSGLGLWISKGIVEKHGGTITVTSNTTGPQRGTTFEIFLPRGEALIAPAPALPAATDALVPAS